MSSLSFWELKEKYKTPENALYGMLAEAEKHPYRKTIHIWHKYNTPAGRNNVAGSESLSRKDLQGRLFNVSWCNDSISIEFTDCIFIDTITGRSYPDKTRCVVVMFPTTEPV